MDATYLWRKAKVVGVLVAIAATSSRCNTSNFKAGGRSPVVAAPMQSKTFQQLSRQTLSSEYRQGTNGAPRSETFDQRQFGLLDILLVMDTSASMVEEQNNLSTKLAPLLSKVGESDWQIAITTTDPADRCILKVISKGMVDADQEFETTIKNIGTTGTGIERHFLRAVDGLKARCLSRPWIRADSTVAVLFVSDEDNCHRGYTGQGQNQNDYACSGSDKNTAYLTSYLSSIRKLEAEARIYGLYWLDGDENYCVDAIQKGQFLAEAVRATNGTAGSICGDYSGPLGRMSEDMARILKSDFQLGSDPDANSLVITVNGQPWTGYTVSGRTVRFVEVPPAGSKIEAKYRSGATGSATNEFLIGQTPFDNSVRVSVNDQPLDPSSARWDPVKARVVLDQVPADGAIIKISYKENLTLQEEFEIGTKVVENTIEVLVNGVKRTGGSQSYDASSGIVKLTPAPDEGAQVVFKWREK